MHGVYQFYLSYVFPRLDGGSSAEPLMIQAERFRAFVSPRRLDEPLFPGDVDMSLSSMWLTIQRGDGVEGGAGVTVALSCLDRIQVVLEWDASIDVSSAHDELQLSLQWAVEMADYYLGHYRCVASSPHVGRILRSWRPEDSQFYIGVPYTVSWFNLDDDGRPLEVFENGANALSSSGAIKAPESGSCSLEALNSSLCAGEEPPLHRSLLIDADGYIQTLGLREATLSLASACEIAARLLIERSGGDSDARVRGVLALGGVPFADRYYNKLPEAVGSRGFALQHEASFNSIKEMYRQRNSLIHFGSFKDVLSEVSRSERQKVVHSWLLAARAAVEWIDAISPSTL